MPATALAAIRLSMEGASPQKMVPLPIISRHDRFMRPYFLSYQRVKELRALRPFFQGYLKDVLRERAQ